MEISEEWYNEGISCLDLVNILKEDESLDKNLKYKTSMCFEKIKSEYRNEKLLMFYILDYFIYDICWPLNFFRYLVVRQHSSILYLSLFS